jgi:hypothetical protein
MRHHPMFKTDDGLQYIVCDGDVRFWCTPNYSCRDSQYASVSDSAITWYITIWDGSWIGPDLHGDEAGLRNRWHFCSQNMGCKLESCADGAGGSHDMRIHGEDGPDHITCSQHIYSPDFFQSWIKLDPKVSVFVQKSGRQMSWLVGFWTNTCVRVLKVVHIDPSYDCRTNLICLCLKSKGINSMQ